MFIKKKQVIKMKFIIMKIIIVIIINVINVVFQYIIKNLKFKMQTKDRIIIYLTTQTHL